MSSCLLSIKSHRPPDHLLLILLLVAITIAAKMRIPSLVVVSALVLRSVSQEMVIPQVEAIVDKAMSKLEAYVRFDGNETATINKRQSTSYWYENIQHQGISAFGPGGYQVYRNVKDYGARGEIFD